jgi:hypothetical protein
VPAPILGQIAWAFSDESERAGVMLLAVVTVDPRAVDDARRALRGPLLRGQRRVHTAKESPSRRRAVIDTIARIEDLSAVVICYRRLEGVDRIRGRHLLLQAATGRAVGSGVVSWTFDYQDPAQRARTARASRKRSPASTITCGPRTITGPATASRSCGLRTRSAGRAAIGEGASPARSASERLAPDAQHPATHRPESTPGALPIAIAMSRPHITRDRPGKGIQPSAPNAASSAGVGGDDGPCLIAQLLHRKPKAPVLDT